MAAWNYDTPVTDPDLRRVEEYLSQSLKSASAGKNASKMLSLYRFLRSRSWASAQELRAATKLGSRPIFTPTEAESVYRQISQKGGAEQAEFFDSVFQKLGNYTGELVPNDYHPYVYYLYNLEQDPTYGPLITTALDTAAQSIPNLAAAIEENAGTIAGFLPIPGGGAAGHLVGYVLLAIIDTFAILLNVSRRNFGAAFNAVLLLVPFVGPALLDAARSTERIVGKISERRAKLIDSIARIMGDGPASYVAELIPDLRIDMEVPKEAPTEPPVLLDQPPTMGSGRWKSLTRIRGGRYQWRRTRRSKRRFGSGSSSTTARATSRRR